ncbi:serine/threonine protein kinase [Pendulispora rubella]|uniref:Serine/threonine protein kinase n=1 Tax=Pendulispora rubella TaxID=2741070 RepID=A0ABZ2LGN9_9BACT
MEERTETFQGPNGPRNDDGEGARPHAPEAGRTLGPYELVSFLGAGGMAEVWVAVRRGGFGFRQVFAIKMIRPEYAKDPAFRAMFLNEARLASHVRHTNVLPVLDLGEEGETVYQAMPLVEGESVAALVKRLARTQLPPQLPLGAALRICIDVARGLHAAHEARDEAGQRLELVHRDVSPHNILVGVDGVAKVADFGIAKAFGLAHTGNGEADAIIGKRAYRAPERGVLDRRADIFSLGVVLWELLTGERLFQGTEATSFLAKAPHVPDVRTHRPDISAAIAETAARALAADVAARYPSAEDFADAMERAARADEIDLSSKIVGSLVTPAADADETHAPTTSSLPRPSSRRTWPALALGGVLVVAASLLALAPRPPAHAPVVASSPPTVAPVVSVAAEIATADAAPPPPSSKPTPAAAPRRKRAPAPKFDSNPYAH